MSDGILGIWDGHDASVALVCDGVLAFALSEERVSRRKRAAGFPVNALASCLAWAKSNNVRIREVAIAGAHGRALLRCFEPIYAAGNQHRDPLSLQSRAVAAWENVVSALPVLRNVERAIGLRSVHQRLRHLLSPDVHLTTVAHHDAHAGSAMLGRTDGDAFVVTFDAYGEGVCATVRRSSAPSVVLATLPPQSSIAALYGALTVAMGFKEGEEGKVMGLAAAGRPEVSIERFLDLWKQRDCKPLLRKPLDRATVRRLLQGISREDAAAGLQAATMYLLCQYVSSLLSRTRPPWRLLLAGGLFANILLNQAIASIPGVEDVFVFPNMGDGGLSAGAAAMRFFTITGSLPEPIRHVFLGPEPTSIRQAVESCGFRARRCLDIETVAARHIAMGRVVCRFTGRDEFGPRALGNRSILFRADCPGLADRVNTALGRDCFMPFGPAVLDVPGLWRTRLSSSRLGFMTFAVEATAAMRQACPVAVHLDGTIRPQVVDPTCNPSFHRILKKYEELSGKPAVINTSFNLHGEPIVHTPHDAVKTFATSGLDVLLIGDYEIRRPGLEGLP